MSMLAQTTLLYALFLVFLPPYCDNLSDFPANERLLKVVERAVLAAAMDDDEWRARLGRGQKLARKAESNRRDSRDAQRSAEDTIAKQAAELEKLREEAKSRAPRRRSWRSCEVSFFIFSFGGCCV